MSGFLDKFRKKVISSLIKEETAASSQEYKDIDDKIALGVLLWAVAKADNKFLPQEEQEIKNILINFVNLKEEELPAVINSIKEAEEQRIDLYTFTSEIVKNLQYLQRINIVEILFCVACADKELDEQEVELIRKIADLFHLSHRDFIEAKIRAKKKFGLDTAGY